MEYRIVEAALAKLHSVAAEDMGAFRARLRILRDVGVPQIPKVGKGTRADFSREAIEEMHMALTMSEFGMTPARIAQLTGFLRVTPSWVHRDREADDWLIVTLRANAGKLSVATTGNEALYRIGISPAYMVMQDLNFPPDIATWHALLSLRKFHDDIDKLGFPEKPKSNFLIDPFGNLRK